MKKIKTVFSVIVLMCLSGCAAKSSITTHNNIEELRDVKRVSVSTFTCSDPIIAQDIRNIIVEELLNTNLNVIIGGEADVVIEGNVTLSGDQVISGNEPVSASSELARNYISGIDVQLIKNRKILIYTSIFQDTAHSRIPDPPEVIGRKMGARIKEMFSRR